MTLPPTARVAAASRRSSRGRVCPGPKPPFLAVKRPARPHKSAIENRFAMGNAKGHGGGRNAPGRARANLISLIKSSFVGSAWTVSRLYSSIFIKKKKLFQIKISMLSIVVFNKLIYKKYCYL